MSYADKMIDDYLNRLLDAGDDEQMFSKRAKKRRYRKFKRIRQAALRAKRDARNDLFKAMTKEAGEWSNRRAES